MTRGFWAAGPNLFELHRRPQHREKWEILLGAHAIDTRWIKEQNLEHFINRVIYIMVHKCIAINEQNLSQDQQQVLAEAYKKEFGNALLDACICDTCKKQK